MAGTEILKFKVNGKTRDSKARAGSKVRLSVLVKNIRDVRSLLWGSFSATGASMPEVEVEGVDPGESVEFKGSFTMPDNEVELGAQSWHWDEDGNIWRLDEQSGPIMVSLGGVSLMPFILTGAGIAAVVVASKVKR